MLELVSACMYGVSDICMQSHIEFSANNTLLTKYRSRGDQCHRTEMAMLVALFALFLLQGAAQGIPSSEYSLDHQY